ncbi:MAG: PQQ-dependent sugar dehydrogenase [Verrucomicrobia bacterium]|nr:PQQ-dependent sugar dehydrogenase [Verrucomicrobiota bacterium]
MTLPRLRPGAASLALAVLPAVTLSFAAQPARPRPNTVAQRYAELCASCHGDKLQGAQAPSMLDDIWVVGGDDASIERSIRTGFPDKGMPAWGAAIPEKEIRAMVIYIREQRDLHRRGQLQFNKPADDVTAKSELHDYHVTTWVGGLKEPYSLAFLKPNVAIVTEKRGYAFLIEDGKLAARPLIGLPLVDTSGQAGLFDVVPHPDYAKNGWLYFAYSDPQKNAAGEAVSLTRILRGRIKDGALIDQETIYQAKPEHYLKAGGVHFGGRIAFDRQGYLYFTIGERGQGPHAQDVTRPNGKVHRIHDDGRVPADNPFVAQAGACATIWSFGHRNPQGLAFHPATGALYDVEHGPRGGDEVNHVQKGVNYGWPVITYGMNYDGTAMTDVTAMPGMAQPVTYWVPSIAPCGANFYAGDLFPKWKHHLFVATLAAQELRRLEIAGDKVVRQEVIFKDLGRIRHVIGGPDGALYVLLPERIARLALPPAPGAVAARAP